MKHLPSWQNNNLISNISKSAPKPRTPKSLVEKRRDGCLQKTKGKPKENQSRDGCLENTNSKCILKLRNGEITLIDPKKYLTKGGLEIRNRHWKSMTWKLLSNLLSLRMFNYLCNLQENHLGAVAIKPSAREMLSFQFLDLARFSFEALDNLICPGHRAASHEFQYFQ